MPIKILIVDDSVLFCNYLCAIINSDPELQVIDVATNGKEAFDKIVSLSPDVVTMDITMPVMDGIITVRKIMENKPTPILMLSAITVEGARATFDALEAGALDFLPKIQNFSVQGAVDNSADIIGKIKALAQCKLFTRKVVSKYEVVLIGASTGGPMALQTIMRGLLANFPAPIIIVQHMPENFTKPFADRINAICGLTVKEASHDDIITPGNVYIAPGGKQISFKKQADKSVTIAIKKSDIHLYYRPSIDVAFTSASSVFHGKVLTLILTGMGVDGREGVKALKRHGNTTWIQDEKTSVVFGMPQAILDAGLADKVLSLDDISKALINEIT